MLHHLKLNSNSITTPCNFKRNTTLVKGKKIYKFRANNGTANFPSRFCLGSISNEFESDDLRKLSFKRNAYNFSVDYVLLINLTL